MNITKNKKQTSSSKSTSGDNGNTYKNIHTMNPKETIQKILNEDQSLWMWLNYLTKFQCLPGWS